MFLSFTKNLRIKKNKDSYTLSLYSIFIVLFLFINHLILIPFTFTSLWHCPMMQIHSASNSIPMSMCDETASTLIQTNQKLNYTSQNNQKHHRIFICPFCNGLAIFNPLLNSIFVFPELTINHFFLKHKVYQAQPPPILPVEIQLPRAPPHFF